METKSVIDTANEAIKSEREYIERCNRDIAIQESVISLVKKFPIGSKVDFLGKEYVVRWIGTKRVDKYDRAMIDVDFELAIELFSHGDFSAKREFGAGDPKDDETVLVGETIDHIKLIS